MPVSSSQSDIEPSVLKPDPLFAWCIVPFDGKKRGPEERAEMLSRLGFRSYAYDWREEHVPTFNSEIEAMRRRGVDFLAWWMPGEMNETARRILGTIDRFGLRPQLWVTFMDGPCGRGETPEAHEALVRLNIERLAPYVAEAAKRGLKVGLYNHGGWFGEPENQLELIERFRQAGFENLGIVYNLHHGHGHMERFSRLWELMRPHLLALNINGMVDGGDKDGRKIMPLAQGDRELELLRFVANSGWRGPIGLLNHTNEDSEARLRDNLDGFAWVQDALAGKSGRPRPTPRSWRAL